MAKKSTFDIAVNIILFLFGLVFIFPFFWMFITSLKLPENILQMPPKLIPEVVTFKNYKTVFTTIPILQYFFNTIRFALVSTVAIVFTSSLAGYTFAKYKFRFKEIFFVLMITTMMVPFQSYMIPLYLIMVELGVVNKYLGLQLPYLVQAMGMFFMRQNFTSFPDDYLEAGRIEGLSEFGLFFRIALPNVQAAIGGLSIFIFSITWGNLIWPLIILSSEKQFVLELGLVKFQERFTVLYGEFTAAATIAVLPVIIFFIVFRKKMMSGITLAGLK